MDRKHLPKQRSAETSQQTPPTPPSLTPAQIAEQLAARNRARDLVRDFLLRETTVKTRDLILFHQALGLANARLQANGERYLYANPYREF